VGPGEILSAYTRREMDLTDEQWKVFEPLIPEPPRRTDGRGRPWRDARKLLNGILWILRTGASWQHDLPERYPPYQSCHRRFQRWIGEGVLSGILEVLAEDLEECGGLERVSKLEPYAESDLAPADHS
jgi:transposase